MRLTHPETLRGLVHRAGLVAEVLNDGELYVGDIVKVEPGSAETTRLRETPARQGSETQD